jgi:hypothetical protein
MAITKETNVDKIEVVGKYNAIQIATATISKKMIKKFLEVREAFDCGHITGDDNTWVDTDCLRKTKRYKTLLV